MQEIDAETTADYLRRSGRVPRRAAFASASCAAGSPISCCGSTSPGRPPFVIKQCRERLRVRDGLARPARPDLDRVRHARACSESILPEGTVPRVLFDDRPNYLFAMTCAPDDAVTWKSQLDGRPGRPRDRRPAGYHPGHDPRRWRRDTPPCAGRWPTPASSTSCGSIPTTGPSPGASGPGPAHRCADRRDGSA